MIDFHQLKKNHCAVIDTATIEHTAKYPLRQPLPFKNYDEFKENSNQNIDLMSALNFLSRTIYYEFIAVDCEVVNQLKEVKQQDFDYLIDNNFIKFFKMDDKTRCKIYEPTLEYLNFMIGLALSKRNFINKNYILNDILNDFLDLSVNEEFCDDKQYERFGYGIGNKKSFYYLNKTLGSREIREYGKAINALPRSCYYFELGQQAKVALFLSPTKTKLLRQMEKNAQDSLTVLLKRLKKEKSKSSEELNEYRSFGQSNTITLDEPPILEMIIKNAIDKKISPFQSALEIRESKNAKAFRRIIAELQSDMNDGSFGAARAKKRIDEWMVTVNEWLKTGSNENLSVVKRKLNLETIPYGIGSLLNIVGMASLEIPDPILLPSNEQRFLAFIAEWVKL